MECNLKQSLKKFENYKIEVKNNRGSEKKDTVLTKKSVYLVYLSQKIVKKILEKKERELYYQE